VANAFGPADDCVDLHTILRCVKVGVKHGGSLVSGVRFAGFALIDVAGLGLLLSDAPPSPFFCYAEA